MWRMFLGVGLALALPVMAFAQGCGTADLISELDAADRERLDALVAPHPFAEGNLWVAEKDGHEVTVVGTIHVPDPRLEGMLARLEERVKSADLLVLEVTSDDEAALASLSAEEPEMFFIMEGPTLIDLLGPEDWALAEARLSEMGIPGFLGAKFRPWYMTMTLAMPPCALEALKSGERGLDRRIEGLAESAGVSTVSLDDARAVLELFAEGTREEHLELLRMTLRTQTDSAASTSTFVEAYFDGRAREAWEFVRIQIDEMEIENGEELFEETNEKILVGRNRAWEAKLPGLIDGKDAVIAVGAAHLSGEDGVLRALERMGYSVREF